MSKWRRGEGHETSRPRRRPQRGCPRTRLDQFQDRHSGRKLRGGVPRDRSPDRGRIDDRGRSGDGGSPMSDTNADHPYFHPIPGAGEDLAAHLYRRWQEHEAVVAEWTDPTPRKWLNLEPDIQRGYRAMAVAAIEFSRDGLHGL